MRFAVSIIIPYPSCFHLPALSPTHDPNPEGRGWCIGGVIGGFGFSCKYCFRNLYEKNKIGLVWAFLTVWEVEEGSLGSLYY